MIHRYGIAVLLTIPQIFAQTGLISTIAGTGVDGTAGVGGPAVNAQLSGAGGVAVDSSDNLFIADSWHNRVLRVDAVSGILTVVAGTGVASSTGDNGPASQASVNNPISVAFDAAGNLFIGEFLGQRIRRVDAQSAIITTYAGNGVAAFSGDAGPATGASISYLTNIAFDQAGDLFIADSGNRRIRRVDAATQVITTVAGNGGNGSSPDGTPATGASFAQPIGIGVDASGNLFIPEPANGRIRRVDAATGILGTAAGNGATAFSGDGVPATSSGVGYMAPGMAFDSAGNLFFNDGTGRIRRVDAATGLIGTVAGNGTGAHDQASSGGGGGIGCYSEPIGDNGPASIATLDGAYGLAVTHNGNLIFSDWLDCRVRRVYLPSPYPYTSTVVTTSAPSVVVGQPVTLTATVAPIGASGIPTGSILFGDAPPNLGVTLLGTATLVNGTASLTLNAPTSGGSHLILALYGGDGSFNGSGSPGAPLTVTQGAPKATPTVTVSSVQNPTTVNVSTSISVTVAPPSGNPNQPSGSVQLYDNATSICTGTLTSGVAQCQVTFTAAGTHNLSAFYSGDSNFNSLYSGVFSETVKSQATVSLASNPNPAAAGSAVTFTATVSPSSATGPVQFQDGATNLGSAALVNGTASLSVTTLAPGAHSIQAVYGGDNSDAGASSSILTQTVTAPTTTSLSSSATQIVWGQPVTFTAAVSPATASGSIQFLDGATVLGAATVSGGSAALVVPSPGAGAHSITAAYSGDGSDSPSTSAPVVETVTQATPTLTLTSSANPSSQTQWVLFTVAFSPVLSGATLTLMDGQTTVAVISTGPTGYATYGTSTLTAGYHPLTAVWAGNANVLPGNSAVLNQAVQAPVTLSLTATGPVTYGQPVTFTATVSSTAATGPVQFNDGGTLLGTVTLASGVAAVTVPSLNAGSHWVVATYAGDGIYFPTNAGLAVNVAQVTTTAALTASPNPSNTSQPVTLTATVSPAAANGQVNFMDGATLVGVGTLSGGTASVFKTFLTGGSHALTAVYTGALNYAAATSPVVTQTVQSVTTTSLAGPGASTYGQSVQLTASVSPAAATGTVQFLDGSTSLGAAAVSGGSGSLALSTLAVGTHTITASYSGDAGDAPSTSAVLSLTVSKAASTAALSASPNPSTFGQAVTLTAAVSPSSATGSVQFMDGSVSLGAAAIVSGTATLAVSTLSTGTHSLSAAYSGDGNYLAAASSAVTETVKAVTTALLAGPGASTYGQSVQLTASVSPATATGSVRFLDGATSLGSVAVSGGSASLTISTLAVGAHSITASYSGDAADTPSTSATLALTVSKATSSATLGASPNPSTFGQSVTLTAAVSPSSATGSVQFLDGPVSLGTAAIVGGNAALVISALAAGTHSLSAVYGGDANYLAANSAAWAQTVNRAGTATVAGSSPNPAVYTQSVTFTAAVSPASATGSMQFLDGATVIGTASVSGGSASFATSSLAVGSHSISASYSGDSNYTGSSSGALAEVVKLSTTTSLSSNGTPSNYGHTVQFTAVVSPGAATGTVQFVDGATLIGTAAVSSGKATFSTSLLTGGTHSITAIYSGDSTHFPSTSAAWTETINRVNASVSLSASPNPSSAGQAVTFTATVSAAATGSVQFLDGSTDLGTVPLSGETASLTISTLVAGSHAITAAYSGDTNYNPAVSGVKTQKVK